MAGVFKVGQFAARAGTGSQAITGVGFEPVALIVWGQLIQTGTSGFRWSIYGFVDDSIAQYGGSATENDTPSGTSDVNSAINSQLIYGVSFLNSPEMVASLTSMDTDGFTLNWVTNDFGTAAYFNYLAIGGSGVSAKVGTFSGPAGAALPEQAITGVGFRPHVLLGFHTHGVGVDGARESFGWCDSRFRQGVSLITSKHGQNPSKTRRLQRTDGMFVQVEDVTDTVTALAEVTSFDADGFTVNWIVQPGSSASIYYLALRGVGGHIGSFDQPTATGNQDVTGLGFTPSAVLFQSIGPLPVNTLQNGVRLTRGASDGTSELSVWCGSENNVSPVSSSRAVSTAKAIQLYTERATLNAEADLTAFNDGSFRLNWTTVDSTVRRVLFLAFSADPLPTLVSISPTSGPVAGGTDITVTGTNFPAIGTFSLTFGGKQALNVVRVSSTELTCDTPPHAAGLVDVVISTINGSSTLTGAFTYIGSFATATLLSGPVRRAPAITINHQLNSGNSALSFTKEGVVAVGATTYVEDPFNSRRLFTGPILRSAVTFDGDAIESTISHVQCADKRWFLDKKLPYGKWENIAVATLVAELLKSFAPDFSSEVAPGLPAIKALEIHRDKPLSTVLANIAEVSGSHYRLDSQNNKVIIGPPSGDEVPDAINDSSLKLMLDEPITKDTDLSQIRTRVYVFGIGATGSGGYLPPVAPWEMASHGHELNYDILASGGITITNGGVFSPFYQLSAITDDGEAFTLNGGVGRNWVTVYELPTPSSAFSVRFNQIDYHPDSRVTKIGIYRTPQTGGIDVFKKVGEIDNDPVAALSSGFGTFTDTMAEADLITTAPDAPKINTTATIVAVRNDLTAQAALAALEGGDGVREFAIFDASIVTLEAAEQRGDAELAMFKNPLVTVGYCTIDEKSVVGREVSINLTNPPIVGTFKIQDVKIDRIHDSNDAGAKYHVIASSQRYTLSDLLRTAVIGGGGGGGASGGSNISGGGGSGGPTGWATQADRFTTPRTINGVSFDGTANITVLTPHFESILTNGDSVNPEVIFTDTGDVIVCEVPRP